ncbi:MAG: aldose 1-epimerase family protein [Chloroflexota bacterium]|nr:aldose 1-epimerase family protein [Chloroflexota bacterium]
MQNLFGNSYTGDDLRRMTGSMAQLAGVRLSELLDGRARGMRVADVYTGSGFRFQVLLDRALDIGTVEYAGRPLAWVHPALGGPELYEPQGEGWARTFGGGLLTTCGLTFFGQPEKDGDEELGLHGRISHQRGEGIRVTEEWRGDEYVIEVEGQARQTMAMGENLLLARKLSTHLGATSLTLTDRVRNDGYTDTPHMILYHCNFGFPVVSPHSELLASLEDARPRDEAAARGFPGYARFDPPEPDYAEQVFFHKPCVDAQGYSQAAIVNRELGFGAYVRYRAAELPCLAQWKMMGAGDYVCALEPANQWETPRRVLREEGRLRYLSAGEEVEYHVELGVLPDTDAVAAFEAQLPVADPARRVDSI